MTDRATSLHYKYWIGILTVLVIAVVSVRWGSVPDVLDRINFAVALTSLVLAAFAIGYAMISGAQIMQRLGGLQRLQALIGKSAESLDQSIEEFEGQLREFPDLVGRVDSRVEDVQRFLEDTQSGPPESQARMRSGVQQIPEDPPNTIKVALLIATLSADTGIPVNIGEIAKILVPRSPKMVAGFLVGVWSTFRSQGLVDYGGQALALEFTVRDDDIAQPYRDLAARIESDPEAVQDEDQPSLGSAAALRRAREYFANKEPG